MRKIPCLFQRDFDNGRLVRPEVTPGCEWVLAGEGFPSVKWDGTACMVSDGKLFKRFDRKATKAAWRLKQKAGVPLELGDYKPAPEGWEACQEPDPVTGHWPGWVPVGDGPEDRWHREAWEICGPLPAGTYELVGTRINGNPYNMNGHELWPHGTPFMWDVAPRNFDTIRGLLKNAPQLEGFVYWHPDGRMVKIRRRDFGLEWPPNREAAP